MAKLSCLMCFFVFSVIFDQALSYYYPYYGNQNYQYSGYSTPYNYNSYYGNYYNNYYNYYNNNYYNSYYRNSYPNYYNNYYGYNSNSNYYTNTCYQYPQSCASTSSYYSNPYSSGYNFGNYGGGTAYMGTRYNMGIDPITGSPEAGNVGWGNNVAAFFLSCRTCGRG